MKPNLKDMRLFIWDFDGTLMDTYPVTYAAYLQLALRDLGYAVPQDAIIGKMLVNVGHAIDYYTELYHLPQLREQYEQYHAKGAIAMPEGYPQIKETLERIRELGGINCIFTHRDASIYPMLEHGNLLQEFREIIIPGDAHFAVKPAPDAVRYLMERHGATPEATVMVGDRACDLGSGRNAGCHTLHLLTPAAPEYPECDWRIENYGQMLEMLK